MKQVLKLDNEGVHIIDHSISELLEKKQLSPSMITGLENCPAKWVADSFVLRDIMKPDADSPALRGSYFHEVMEEFFKLPPEERSKENLKGLMNQFIKDPEFKILATSKDSMAWIKTAFANYYKMGAQPEKVRIATIEVDGKEREGLEIFVRGNIGGTERDILGLVDRVVERQDGDGYLIEDYKTGKVYRWKNHTKSDDGLAEQRQQIIYTILMRKMGINVNSARLVYPVYKEIVPVELENKELVQRVISDVKEADENLKIMEENNTFEFNPTFLCSWCSLSKICTKAQLNRRSDKMRTAHESQPDPEFLEHVIEVG